MTPAPQSAAPPAAQPTAPKPTLRKARLAISQLPISPKAKAEKIAVTISGAGVTTRKLTVRR